MAIISGLIQSHVNLFGLIEIDSALFAFLLCAVLFGGLNLLEYKKFW